ncbi:DUF6471 domain-containing protein [Hyphomonas oceanitis]
MGLNEKKADFRNKLSRGNFTEPFVLQCLNLTGVQKLDVTGL